MLALILLGVDHVRAEDSHLYSHEPTYHGKRKSMCNADSLLHNIPGTIDCLANSYTPPAAVANETSYQIREFLGFSSGRRFKAFMYPDRASMLDSIETRKFYRHIMRNQSEEQLLLPTDILSPFDRPN